MSDIQEINLYEYKSSTLLEKEGEYLDKLELFLNDIWKKRDKNDSFFVNEDDIDKSTQQFISFPKNNSIKQNNYVGVIQFNGKTINLLPKIFDENTDLNTINHNIIWWLSYTSKIKFPKNISSISSTKADFLEVMIWLFASYTKDILSKNLYQNYVDVESETSYVKGQFMFNEYINGYLARAKWDKVYCRYDSYELDNQFNRIIKLVSNQLLNFTKNTETKRYLQDIVFILSEVSDENVTLEDCNKVKINHFQNEFETILEYCKLFLANSISINYKNNLQLFAFLIPMEKLFEEFIFGFIEKELKDEGFIVTRKDKYLTKNDGYKLKPDLKINYNGKEFLADTKYKIIYSDNKLSQNDLYQMVAYAIRYKCENIILFYPEVYIIKEEQTLKIEDELSNKIINIHPYQLPIKIKEYNQEISFIDNFEVLRSLLKNKINFKLEEIAK